MTGIYQIQSLLYPDRIYVGSAISIPNRWYNHLRRLKLNQHNNNKLQNHYNKYGESDFIFSVLLECNQDVLLEKEQSYIDGLNPWFNLCKKAGSLFGHRWKVSEKGRENLSKNHADISGSKNPMFGKHHSIDHRKNISNAMPKCSVIQFDKNHNFIKRFESIEEVNKVLHILPSKISECINHKKNRNTAGGYVWEREFEKDISTIYSKPV